MSLLRAPRGAAGPVGGAAGLLPSRRAGLVAAWGRERRPAGWRPVDAVIAGLALLLLVEEIWLGDGLAPRLALTVAAAPVALPLAWRTTHPGVAAVVASTGLLLTGSLSTGELPPQLTILPVLVLLYSAASRLRGRVAGAVAAATVVLVVSAHLVTPDGDAADFWPWLLWGGAWLSGTFVQRRTEAAAGHAARAALLESRADHVAREAALEERDRIARELHDVVAHAVSLMVVQAGAERLRLGTVSFAGDGETRRALAAIEESGRRALSELRTMLGVLRDAEDLEGGLLPVPGLADLPALVDRLRDTGLPVTLSMEPESLLRSSVRLPGATEVAAYRIVQESLTNVLRHAGPVQTRIDVRGQPSGFRVEVTSDGPVRGAGAPTSALGPLGDGAGRGLVGMRERAAAVGGTLEAGPWGRGGFRVCAVLPGDETGSAL